ncbi:CTAG modification methylase / site-specific DNA-methyltransferase (cytosine-N4-specific) [Haloferax mediterranei ATCC 33500]|uniref:Type II methyltransferase n=1 Tax=Haloferax mediterranei (strain ATCC 33500 / DSM 1411 / JCM 8866 / NBRC 14739 / NCIMB 2177 / R-4) TaxID=523841 RepID=M0J2I8_HALMT|nr:CTAG modification methylase / site-specific DNA-methyltransferase (cytosine-N4-specific) [Haloferax mediterranei ATCC 33500]
MGDAADTGLADESVDLVVTSPPYPMIEMWDSLFSARDEAVSDALDSGDGDAAFEAMHEQLDAVWDEVERVLAPGGIACVNVGDATRSLGGSFQQYPNHARVLTALSERGLTPLPDAIWRKPTNRLTKFMGSGTLPPNAYVTLEHEYVLVVRKGDSRSFPPGDEMRYESAFFWEERNQWFSDLWEFTGTDQELDSGTRDRSAAFPVELPLRLIRMYSIYGDTVFDPFAGTGTTTLAAMLAGRDSVGYDLDSELISAFEDRLDGIESRSRTEVEHRLDAHRSFVADRDERPGHDAEYYDFPVVTKQERNIRLYAVSSVTRSAADEDRQFVVEHEPVDATSDAPKDAQMTD